MRNRNSLAAGLAIGFPSCLRSVFSPYLKWAIGPGLVREFTFAPGLQQGTMGIVRFWWSTST
jgi:hypothetical protein